MTRVPVQWFGIVLVIATVAIAASCDRSPEARRARYLAKGSEYLEKRDYPRAVLQFRNAIAVTPNDAESYYRLGLASAGAGDLRTAVLSYRHALELNPKHAGAQLKLSEMMVMASENTWLSEAEDRLKELASGSGATAEALNALATAEIRLGKMGEAEQALNRALAASPQELTAAVTLARVKLSQKDVAGAERVLRTTVDATPNSASGHAILAEFYALHQRFGDAETEARRAIAIDAKNGLALMTLARVLNTTGRKPEAARMFQDLSQHGTENYRSTYALYLYSEGRTDEAIRELERLSKENADNRTIRTQLVAGYRSLERDRDAENVLNTALKKNPNDVDALLQRGELYIAFGRYDQAEADLNKIAHMDANVAAAHYALGRLHTAKGSTLRAREEFDKAIQINPFLLPARIALMQNFLAGNDGKAALQVADQAPESMRQLTALVVQRNWALWSLGEMNEMRKRIDAGLTRERAPDLLVQDGLWKLQSGHVVEARAVLEEALKVNPSDMRALQGIAQTYQASKQPALALQKIKEYAATQPKSVPVQQFLGTTLMAQRDTAGARAAFQAAKATDPNNRITALSLVQLDIMDSKWDDAATKLNVIVAANPADATARLWLGNIEATRGNTAKALDHYRMAVAAKTTDTEALNNYAYLLCELAHQYDQALAYAQKAVELAPDNPEIGDTLGLILYRKGLYRSAVQQLERANGAKKAGTAASYHLAMAYTKSGDPAKGKAILQAALKQNPNAPEAKAAREVVEANQ
jgi:tetratricopeptide (TPR) repeat protein